MSRLLPEPNTQPLRLTQTLIQRLPLAQHTYVLWDTVQPGLGVKVRPSGHTVYIARLSIQGQMRRKVLAPTDALSIRAARQACQQQRHRWQQAHQQPSDQQPITTSPRLDAFVTDVWTDQVLSQWKASTQHTARSILKTRLLPAFGRYPLHTITHAMVYHWFTATSRTKPGAANRNLDVLQSILKLAVIYGYCQSNPAAGIKQNKRRVLNRFLSRDEIQTLHCTLDQMSARDEHHFQCSDIVRLLLVTGCRASEIVQLRWSWIQDRKIHLPDSKTGARVVYIGDAARAILQRHRNLDNNNDVVFPLPNGQPRQHINHFWQTVREQANIADVRLHDLRHTFASYAVMAGYTLPMVAKLLGHKKLSMTLRYAHVSDPTVEAAAEQIGQRLYQLASGRAGMADRVDSNTAPDDIQPPIKAKNTHDSTKVKRMVLTITDKQRQAIEHCAKQKDMPPETWMLACIREAARKDGNGKKDRHTYARYQRLRAQHRQYQQTKRHSELVLTLPAVAYAYYQSIAEQGRLSAMQWARVVVLERVVDVMQL